VVGGLYLRSTNSLNEEHTFQSDLTAIDTHVAMFCCAASVHYLKLHEQPFFQCFVVIIWDCRLGLVYHFDFNALRVGQQVCNYTLLVVSAESRQGHLRV